MKKRFYCELMDQESQQIEKVYFSVKSRKDLLILLKQQAKYPLKIKEVSRFSYFFKNIFSKKTTTTFTSQKALSLAKKSLFFEQMTLLLQSGIPLAESLKLNADLYKEKPLGVLSHALMKKVKEGESLSSAMATYNFIFDDFYVSIIRTGEISGVIARAFFCISSFLKRRLWLKDKLLEMSLYPFFIFLLTISVIVVLMLFVLPRFNSIFIELGIQLPASTRFLIGCSQFLVYHTLELLVCVLTFFICFVFFMKTRYYQEKMAMIMVHIPFIKDFTMMTITIQISMTLSLLLENGVPISRSVKHLTYMIQNPFWNKKLQRVFENLENGVGLGIALKEEKIFPPIALSMVFLSEETGTLDTIMGKIASIYEQELEKYLTRLVKIIEPVLIISMSLIVGFVVISLFYPLISMIDCIA